MTCFKSSFIGDFKLGDNINYNLRILNELYSQGDTSILNKPKTIIIASIIEAILFDFFFKAKFYTREGIRNISNKILQYIRHKRIDKFHHYIQCAKKHELFGSSENEIYSHLEELRKLRNRIHIQNEKNHFESNESEAFSVTRRILAENTLIKIMDIMYTKHDRGHGYVKDFDLPW